MHPGARRGFEPGPGPTREVSDRGGAKCANAPPLRHVKHLLIRSRRPHESAGFSPVPRVGSTTHPRASPLKKRQRILRRSASTAAAGITGTDRPELSASAGPAGSTEAASSASSGPAGSTAAASSSAAPSAGPAGSTAAASTADGITGSPTTSPATRHKILTSGGDGGNCGPRSASAGRTPAEASSTARAARRAT